MPRYSNERREAALAKLLPPHSLTVKQVAEQGNIISEPTIYKWRHETREQGQCFPDSDHPDPEGWTSRDKFAAVLRPPP